MELSFVNQVRPYRTSWRLQVKVLHTWKQFTPLSGETLEIVFSDAYGNKIHASCKKIYFDRLENKVPVGAWRNIDNFLVTNNGGSYKTTNHQYKIVFIPTTDITPSTLQEENMFLSLVDFESIQSGKLDTTNLIDVIGQVFELGDLETVQCHVIKRYLAAFGESLLKQYTVSANNLMKKLLYA
ncbi:unnamed protein product [Brassica rapa]|uniref:Replication protein A 70 kDa DNA-binding subunit B/D first OB fold domain-containing protein n=1 Tax=Brassica campestris TaxID=3711 RepID=A0A3P6AHK2_BRACM|nr:unnamed protein product [Brassica rapa]VDC89115.1 unnamed protein product [Brassica rapa]